VAGATATITVNAPVWYKDDGSTAITTALSVEAGNTIDVIIKDATDGALMEDVVPTITGGTGKLTASKSGSDGVITLTAASNASGTFTVEHNGASFTVNVDKYSISADRYIINKSDTEHDNAVITVANTYAAGTTVLGKNVTAATVDGYTGTVDGLSTAISGSGNSGTVTVTATGAGNVRLAYGNESIDLEVVDYSIATHAAVGGVAAVVFKKNGTEFDGATFKLKAPAASPADITKVSVQGTTDAGVYKVSNTASTSQSGKKVIVEYYYKNVLVADFEVTLSN
jgi:hypothetical protein